MSGDQALAQGAFEAGLKVAASYPGTPASEILEYLSGLKEVDVQWSVNEKVAFEVALSSAIAGLRSLYASKHVGLNVAMDPLMTSAYIGVNAGFVIVSCDDPGIHSSQNEQDNRLLAKAAKIPLLEPSSPRQAQEFVKTAFDISERFDTPVLVRLTTRIAHTKENLFKLQRNKQPPKEFKLDPKKYVMVPRNAYLRHIELEKRLIRLKEYAEASALNKVELKSAKIGFITNSAAYLYARECYPDASFLNLGMSFPFPDKKVLGFARQVRQLYCLEELEPFIEEHLRMLGIKFKSKDASFRVGELRPEMVPLIVKGSKKKEEALPTRKPVMCTGCTHRMVFWVLKKLKLVVTGDIGCYTLGALPPLSSLHTCLCMGAGVTFLEGFNKVLGKGVVGVIGDSTFIHTGIAGLINLAYNKTKGLLFILDNGTTAMTGSQPHPGVGLTIRGEQTQKLDLKSLCLACGADTVDVVDPYDFKTLEETVIKRIGEGRLSVIIARAPCQLIKRKRDPQPVFSRDACKKCYLCLTMDCPALRKDADGYIEIDSSVCSGCNLCTQACKFGALTKRGV